MLLFSPWRKCLYIFVFCFFSFTVKNSFASSCRSSQSLTERLNTIDPQIIKSFKAEDLWFSYLEENELRNDHSPSFRDDRKRSELAVVRQFHLFLRLLSNQDVTRPESLSELIFGSLQVNDGRKMNLYPHLVFLLRHIVESKKEFKCINRTTAELAYINWQEQYIQKSLGLIEQLSMPGYEELIDSFRRRWGTKELEVIDLSPKKRKVIAKDLPANYADLLVRKAKDTKEYIVKGFYYGSENMFALDLAKNPHETLYVFAHELVHAGNLHQIPAQRKMESLKLKVQELFRDLLGSSSGIEELLSHSMEHLSLKTLELGNTDTFDYYLDKKIRSFQQFKDKNSNIPLRSLDYSELALLDNFAEALLDLSLVDEYQAYALSTVAYHQLVRTINMPASKYANRYIELLRQGDANLAKSLFMYNSISPFDGIRRLLLDIQIKNTAQNKREKLRTTKDYIKFLKLLNLLEALFLEKVKNYIVKLESEAQFSSLLEFDGPKSSSFIKPPELKKQEQKEEGVDYFEKKNHYDQSANVYTRDDLDNPFAVIGSQMTPTRLLRFRENLEVVGRNLDKMIQSFQLLRNGILDFKSVSLGEMELLGYLGESSLYKNFYRNTSSQLQKPKSEIPEYFFDFFHKVRNERRSRQRFLVEEKNQVLYDLSLLQLLKIYNWLDKILPIYNQNMLGIKNYFEKIEKDNYSKEHFKAHEIKAMYQHLQGSKKSALLNFKKMEELKQSVFSMDKDWGLASSPGFNSVSNALFSLQNSLLGVFPVGAFDLKRIESEAKQSVDLRQQTILGFTKQFQYKCSRGKINLRNQFVSINDGKVIYDINFYCRSGEPVFLRYMASLQAPIKIYQDSSPKLESFKLFPDSKKLLLPVNTRLGGNSE